MDDLLGHRERARDQGLRRDHGGHGGKADQGQQGPIRRHQVERVFDGFRVVQQQGALTEIIQGECRHHDRKPGEADRFFPEMPHVGIQGLAAGHAQDHRPQNDEGGAGVVPHKAQSVMRADRPQDPRLVNDVAHAQNSDGDKPDHGDRAEELANAGCATLLHGKQAKQNHQRERDHKALEARRYHLQTLHGRQHRNGRGNHPVTIEQAGSKDAQQQQYPAQLWLVFDRLGRQGQHGHQPAFAMVVGPQNEHHVLDGDDDRQGPEEDGENSIDILFREGDMAGAEDLFERVQHTGADVAVYNADGTERECRERRFGC